MPHQIVLLELIDHHFDCSISCFLYCLAFLDSHPQKVHVPVLIQFFIMHSAFKENSGTLHSKMLPPKRLDLAHAFLLHTVLCREMLCAFAVQCSCYDMLASYHTLCNTALFQRPENSKQLISTICRQHLKPSCQLLSGC